MTAIESRSGHAAFNGRQAPPVIRQKTSNFVQTELTFIKAPEPATQYYAKLSPLGPGEQRTNLQFEAQRAQIYDMRQQSQRFNLRDNGFQLERLVVPDDIDWTNLKDVSLHKGLQMCLSCMSVQKFSGN